MSTDSHTQAVGRGEAAVAHCVLYSSGIPFLFLVWLKSGSRNHSSEECRNHLLESHLSGDKLFGASGMRKKKWRVEDKRGG